MNRYLLYGGRFTRAIIVEMVMAEGGLEYDLEPVDIMQGEQRLARFLAMNAAGHVPILVCPDGEILSETPAINLYLADHHGLNHLAPAIDDPLRGRFLSYLSYLSGDFEPAIKQYYYPHLYVLRGEDEIEYQAKSLAYALQRLQIIEQRLQNDGPYHLGERFSLLDIILGFWTVNLDFGQNLQACPAVKRCLELVENRPLLQSLFADLRDWGAEYQQLVETGGGAR